MQENKFLQQYGLSLPASYWADSKEKQIQRTMIQMWQGGEKSDTANSVMSYSWKTDVIANCAPEECSIHSVCALQVEIVNNLCMILRSSKSLQDAFFYDTEA